MTQPNVTTDELAMCLSLLESAEGAMTAIELAVGLHLSGNRETQRRHIRHLIRRLREDGSMIMATLQDGYYLTSDSQLYEDYLAGRQIGAKKVLGETHRRKKMLVEVGTGQGVLFSPLIGCGHA